MDIGGNSKVLVGVDGTPSNRAALAWALDIARCHRRELVAVYAWHLPAAAYGAPGFVAIDRAEMNKAARSMIDAELAEVGAEPEVAIDVQVIEGPAHAVLRDLAANPEVGLVVVGTRGHGTAAGAVLGSVSHALSHSCPKPIVIVPQTAAGPDGRPRPVRRVVVGVDGSPGAAVAAAWAAAEAKARGATLEVVTAWTWSLQTIPVDTEGDSDFEKTADRVIRNAADNVLGHALDGIDTAGLEVRHTGREGRAADVLIEVAATADLLVVGSRGRGRAIELFVGSVSHAVAHHAPVPVAIIPHS